MNGVHELSIERDEEWWILRRDGEAEIALVRLGGAVIETTFPYYDVVVRPWFRHMAREHRRRRGPLVAGLAAFRGLSRRGRFWWHGQTGPTSNPAHPSNPISAIAICLGGHHVLLYQDHSEYGYRRWKVAAALRDFLADRRITVVGLGIKKDAEKLKEEWGLEVARPVELRTLAAAAFGKERVFEWTKKKRALVMVAKGLEELARMVLGGMRVKRKPARVEESDYRKDYLTGEQMMYAARDAHLCFEIGLRCMKMIGFRT